MKRHQVVAAMLLAAACGRIGIDRRDEHGMTALMRASRAGDVTEVRRLIDRGANVNAVVPTRPIREMIAFLSWMQQLPKSDYGYTPLHYAADSSRVEIARLLMAKGADPLAKPRGASLSPMDLAIFRSDLPTLEVLTSRGARPSAHQLWLAVANGGVEIVRLVLDRGADVKGDPEPFAANRRRPPLVIVAVQRGDPEILRMLLAAGVDPNARDANGWTALRHLRSRGDRFVARQAGSRADADARTAEMVRLLEGRGASDPGGMRAAELFDALYKLNVAGVRAALASGANPNALGDRGVPPLVWAAGRGADTIVAILVDAGAHVNASPEFDTTPLIAAIRAGSVPSVKKLLAAGARADQPDRINLTPLQVAASERRTEIAELLLASSAKVDKRALPGAALAGDVALVRLLIANGADVAADSGHALNEAARGCTRRDNTEVIAVLLDAGANPRIYRDMSALHRAAGLCPIAAVRALLDRGADPNARSIGGSTPLVHAAFSGRLDVVELLIANRADVNARDDDGKSVLQHAARHPDVQVALRRAGAR